MDTSGKIAVVSGANGGLGEAFVRRLADRCAIVHAGVRRPEDYVPPADNVSPLHLDLSSRESIDAALTANPEVFGKADILINNAGVLAAGLLEELEPDLIDAALQVNLAATIHLSRAVLPGMLERKRGAIVNNASFSGYVHLPMATVYAASKAGVVAFSEALRREVDGTGVAVTHLVTPGVKTPMLEETERAYGDHFDTSGWDAVEPDEWAAKTIEAIEKGSAVVHPGGKTRLGILASRGPGGLLDGASKRMFKR